MPPPPPNPPFAGVVSMTRGVIVWPFRGEPFIPLGSRHHRRTVVVDPMPAYPHEQTLVAQCLKSASTSWPVHWPVTLYVLPVEDVGRTNGSTFVDYDYSVGEVNNHPVTAYIALSAKRIQPHPAMTRYLVIHEYAHVLEDYLNTAVRGNHLGSTETEQEYAELRGLKVQDDMGGGLWHSSPCEIMANDFRLLVAGVEPEYWPHPGIDRPAVVGTALLRGWWDEQLRAIRERAEAGESASIVPIGDPGHG